MIRWKDWSRSDKAMPAIIEQAIAKAINYLTFLANQSQIANYQCFTKS